MSIQSAKGACMVCSQQLVLDCWPTQRLNHRDVLCSIHGIQMCTEHGNLREVLSLMALLIIDGVRWDLSGFSFLFRVFSPGPFWVGWGRYGGSGWFLWARWRTRFDRNGLNGGKHNLGHWRLGQWVEAPYRNSQREVG